MKHYAEGQGRKDTKKSDYGKIEKNTEGFIIT
jgi:hypothetical protein